MFGKKLIKTDFNPGKAFRPAFTIIELLIVVTLTVLLMLTATSLFMATLVGNTKGTVTQKVKEEGDYALSQIELMLRNAVSLKPNLFNQTCTSNMTSIAFQSMDNGITTFQTATDVDSKNKIASSSAIQTAYLTSGTVEIVGDLDFDCTQSSDGSKTYITVNFTLRKGTPGIDEARNIVEQQFSTSVAMRTY